MKNRPLNEKLRGAYYTPEPIARFLSAWGIRSANDTILEPSCGDGNIVLQAAYRCRALKTSSQAILGYELSAPEAQKARTRLRKEGLSDIARINSGDFFAAAAALLRQDKSFDLVIGNPPFIRYQDFSEEQRAAAFALMQEMGLTPTRLANAWLPFLAIAVSLVGPAGRLAMVLPAELFQVGYAAQLRKYLSECFAQIDVVTFSKLVFDDIQQEVVLLLADRTSLRGHGVRIHEVRDAAALSQLDLAKVAEPLKPIDHSSEKWTQYFLDTSEILLLRELRQRPDITLLGQHLDVDVGVVTGDNDFFLLNADAVRTKGLSKHALPVVGRSAALRGLKFTSSDLNRWLDEGASARLFFPKGPVRENAARYIAEGERRGVHKGYKCRIRKEWFRVPSVWTPDAFYLRQADMAPRLVANETGATCTDTLHRARLLNGIPARVLALSFTNSLTFAASEITGRSYGGGVMTYEPSEVERLPLPVEGVSNIDFEQVDVLIRTKRLEDALEIVDRHVLIDGLGLSRRQSRALRGIWTKLRDRRRGRKASKATSAR